VRCTRETLAAAETSGIDLEVMLLMVFPAQKVSHVPLPVSSAQCKSHSPARAHYVPLAGRKLFHLLLLRI
jgi:hypothetical protein